MERSEERYAPDKVCQIHIFLQFAPINTSKVQKRLRTQEVLTNSKPA